MESHSGRLDEEAERLSRCLAERDFPEVASAIRKRSGAILVRWRARSVEAMPDLHRMTVTQFENSIAVILDLIAGAMESRDPERMRRLIAESPAHGLARFAQDCSTRTLLAEERVFRSALIVELREELARPLSTLEAASLHELLDLMGEYSILAMVAKRTEARERMIQHQVSGMHRLADLGTLVAGVAHDAVNLLLPLRMRLEHIGRAELPDSVRDDLGVVQLLVKQFQNSIVNLRWLSVDASPSLPAGKLLNLNEWSVDVSEFHRRMLPRSTRLSVDLPPDLPQVAISSAALSQAVFNLISNAQQAIMSSGADGAITLAARAVEREGVEASGTHAGLQDVELSIQDSGPGMSPEVLARCAEPFYTTRSGGSGLGLALVWALITSCGGRVKLQSPPPGAERGTLVTLLLPGAPGA